MKDQLSNSVDERARLDAEAANKWLTAVERAIAEDARDFAAEGGTGQHLITVDELRAAGALDVPAAWRKSLGQETDLFSELTDEDALGAEKEQPARIEPACDEPDEGAE